MQQFQVPQFITVEDRIIGPFTLKQFLYLLGAAAVVLITWFLFHIILFVIIGVPVAALFLALAFAKVNGQSFPTVFSNAINYYLKPHLYLWQQTKGDRGPLRPRSEASKGLGVGTESKPRMPESPLADIPKLSESKLSDLAWSLDVKGRIGDSGER